MACAREPSFAPLQRWPQARIATELARVDKRLAALATAPAERKAGAPGSVGALAHKIESRSLSKYRARLTRALYGRRPRR